MKNHSRTALEVLLELREVVYDEADVRIRTLIDEAIEASRKEVPREAEAANEEDRERYRRRALARLGKVLRHLPWVLALLDRLND